ncbi:MAG TPA: M48 family metalloprotease [Gammaproteobacteria bacterium]
MWRHLAIFILLPLLAVPPAFAQGGRFALPDLGSGGISIIAGTREEAIGRSIVNELRRADLILDDPEITEYIQNVGSRLVAGADNGKTDFSFFVIKDDSINAFALPGGYIGVHSGLILRTNSESELASVLAHEVAHVTQRHIARRFDASSSMGLKSLAILLGAIALAASGADGDDVSGAMMLGQGLAIQEQINFTRTQEYEADHVGMSILARSGFDPEGMVNFFETMQRMQRIRNSRMPEFLSTHPLSVSRVTDAAQRIQAMDNIGTVRESRAYPLMKARLAVLSGDAPLLSAGAGDAPRAKTAPARYARALALLEDGEAETAAAILRELRGEDDSITHYHIGLGRALMAAGRIDGAIKVMEHAGQLFPVNVPVGLAHAEALRRAGRAEDALNLLRDLFNRRAPEPENIRVMAQTAADAGAMAESHYYMGEYYLRLGDLHSGRIQLQLAVDNADPASNDYLQYNARLQEVSDILLEQRSEGRGPTEARSSWQSVNPAS